MIVSTIDNTTGPIFGDSPAPFNRIESLRPIHDLVAEFDDRNRRAQEHFEAELRMVEAEAEEQIEDMVRAGGFPFDALCIEPSWSRPDVSEVALAVDILPSDELPTTLEPEKPQNCIAAPAAITAEYVCPKCEWHGVPNPKMRAKCPICFGNSISEAHQRRRSATDHPVVEPDIIAKPMPKFEIEVPVPDVSLEERFAIPSIVFDQLTPKQRESAVLCRAKGFGSHEADAAKEFWLVLVPAGTEPNVIVAYVDVRLSLESIADGELLIERCYRVGRTWWVKDPSQRSGEMLVGRKQG